MVIENVVATPLVIEDVVATSCMMLLWHNVHHVLKGTLVMCLQLSKPPFDGQIQLHVL